MRDVFSLTGRKALVTGGSRGIGAEIVEIFADYGAEVAFCHFNDFDNANLLTERLRIKGHVVHGKSCDVSDDDKVADLALWAEMYMGQVDILVNCAGGMGNKPFADLTLTDWDRMIDVHLRGTFMVTHAFFGKMVARSYGRIINVASQLAYKGAPGLTHYCAAKAGIVGLTRALSQEGAPHGVIVNTVAPNPVETERQIGRFGKVDEIAPTVLMLASQGGGFYIGQTLSPNGGEF